MQTVIFYSLLSVLIVSFISFIGIFSLSIQTERLRRFLIYFISFSAGALFGDAFLHLLPEVVENYGFAPQISFSILGGVLIFFALEKIVHWQHCHLPITEEHAHPFAYMNLFGDALHNFIDGIIIASSYLVSFPAGVATTIAVILHEIPQEIGDFGVLLHGGFSRRKALVLNFLTALTAILGAILAIWLTTFIDHVEIFLVPIAVGGFIYIAGSDLIPELHKNGHNGMQSWMQIFAFIVGIGVMALLLIIG